MTGPIGFDPLTQQIAAAVRLEEGRASLRPSDIRAFAGQLAALPTQRRTQVAVQLLGVANRLWTTGEEAWDEAFTQLGLLALVALGKLEPQEASDRFDRTQARALLDTAGASQVVTSADPDALFDFPSSSKEKP